MEGEGVSRYHYPGFSVEAADFHVKERHMSIFGTDLPVVDGPALREESPNSNRPTATVPVRDAVQRPPNDVIVIEYLAMQISCPNPEP